MEFLSEDDLDLRELDDRELARAWALWFKLAQHTNDDDPLYEHGVFAGVDRATLEALIRDDSPGSGPER